MLGVGYLGVMEQLLKENPDIFKNLKRVAGTSAGSIMALYVGLRLDFSQVSTLMNRSYVDLLDEALVLRVATKFKWFYNYENFTARDVFLKAFAYMNTLLADFVKNPTVAQEKTEDMVSDIFKYYSSKFDNIVAYTAFKYGADSFAQMLIRWLLTIMKPDQGLLLQTSGMPSMNTGGGLSGQSGFDSMLDSTINKVMKTSPSEQTRERTTDGEGMMKMTENEEPLKTAGLGDKLGKDLSKMFDESSAFYLQQKKHSLRDTAADPSQLEGEVLHYAIGEMLWFIFMSQVGARGVKEELGLFSGDIVKEQLIEGAIKMKFESLTKGSEYKPGMTFKELHDKKLFTPFFVCAYNYANRRTETFSVYHTPNVAASDAVRASMSIPIFFTPPKIRENGEPRRVYYGDGQNSEVVRYMDGGILDNYPLWIFDDLKYCLEDIPDWIPDKRFAIQNPKTLGFRLLEKRRIDIYRNPYYDNERMQMKRVGSGAYQSTFTSVMGSLLTSLVNHSIENEHIKRGDCPRTAYVDHLGINPVAFDLTMEAKERLINSGVQAVLDYKERAKTGFVGEGETYH